MFSNNGLNRILGAAHHLVLEHGALKLSDALGSTRQMIINRFNPNCATHHVRLEDAIKATEEAGDDRILAAWAQERGYRLEPIDVKPVDSRELLSAVLSLNSAIGEFTGQLNDAVADGWVSPREEQDLFNQVNKLTGQLSQLALREGTVK